MNGQQIKAARQAAQMTQAELAEKVGVGSRTVSNWERGETVPKNRMAAIEKLFADMSGDPIRAASEATLLAELQRRAAERSEQSA